jgi:DNA-binding MltR family transcriptional regulator
VLVAAAAIDDELEVILRWCFERTIAPGQEPKVIDLLLTDGQMPPLGSFQVRNNLCVALGLVDSTQFKRIRALAQIRNAFSHVSDPVEITPHDIKIISSAGEWNPRTWGTVFRDFCTIEPDELKADIEAAHQASDTRFFSDARKQFIQLMNELYASLTAVSTVLRYTEKEKRTSVLEEVALLTGASKGRPRLRKNKRKKS